MGDAPGEDVGVALLVSCEERIAHGSHAAHIGRSERSHEISLAGWKSDPFDSQRNAALAVDQKRASVSAPADRDVVRSRAGNGPPLAPGDGVEDEAAARSNDDLARIR